MTRWPFWQSGATAAPVKTRLFLGGGGGGSRNTAPIQSTQVIDLRFRENLQNRSNRRTGTRNTHAGQAGTQAVLHIGNVVDWLNLW